MFNINIEELRMFQFNSEIIRDSSAYVEIL